MITSPFILLPRILGMAASSIALALWLTSAIQNIRYPYQNGNDIWLVIVLMSFLALVGVLASWKGAGLWLLLISLVSFVPVGLYLLGVPSLYRLIGVANLISLAAGLLLLFLHPKATK